MYKFLLRMFVILILSITLPQAGTALFSTTPQINLAYSGVGVDIIQGFADSELLVHGEGCGLILISLQDATGKTLLQSPLLKGSQISWSFSTKGWAPGIYLLKVASYTTDCTIAKRININ